MFVDDIPVHDIYYALIIRSSAAKGVLKSVECPALPERFTLITARNIPGENSLFDANMPLLADRAVSYLGEPVAVLAGPEPLALELYAKQCVINIEEEAAVFSIEDAYDAEDFFTCENYETGNLPKTKGELVVEGHYETGIQEHWYSEPHGAIARPLGNQFTIMTASQMPDDTRLCAAKILGIDAGQIHVENYDLGIHLDGKIWYPSVIASLAALAAYVTQKTVKLQLSREEDYLFSPKRTPSVAHVRSLLTFDGQILETNVLAKVGFGAYGVLVKPILDEIARSFMSVYKTGKLTVEALAVRTNTPPSGPFAGFGSSIAAFALERHISKITDTINEEGAFWRNAHLLHKLKERFGETEQAKIHHCIITAVSSQAGFRRKWAAYELLRERYFCNEGERVLPQRGIGIAFALAGNEIITMSGGALPVLRQLSPAAACVIEIEIDHVNYAFKIRGIWLYIAAGKLRDGTKAEVILRRSALAALGWTSTEKIKYTNGKITPPLCAHYQLLSASENPPVHLTFIEEPELEPCDENQLETLPFSAIPAAYTQAISQAINHHFERIPISGQDVWRVINIKRAEYQAQKRRTAEENAAAQTIQEEALV